MLINYLLYLDVCILSMDNCTSPLFLSNSTLCQFKSSSLNFLNKREKKIRKYLIKLFPFSPPVFYLTEGYKINSSPTNCSHSKEIKFFYCGRI